MFIFVSWTSEHFLKSPVRLVRVWCSRLGWVVRLQTPNRLRRPPRLDPKRSSFLHWALGLTRLRRPSMRPWKSTTGSIAGYVRKLNATLDGVHVRRWSFGITARRGVARQRGPAEQRRRPLHHTLYWEVMRPGGPAAPEGDLAELITRDLEAPSLRRLCQDGRDAIWRWLGLAHGQRRGQAGSHQHAQPGQPFDDAMRRAYRNADSRHGVRSTRTTSIAEPSQGLHRGLHERGQLGGRVVPVGGHAFASALIGPVRAHRWARGLSPACR